MPGRGNLQLTGQLGEVMRESVHAAYSLVRSHAKKYTLDAKTPLDVSMRLLKQLYESDLKKIAKSKNISSVLANAAKRTIDEKGKH